MDQDVLPHVLALHRLARGVQAFAATPGVELVPLGKNDAAVEFDFLFIAESQLRAGECKAGTGLGDKDIAAAWVAATLGIREFSFCTVKEFGAEARARVDQLIEELGTAPEPMTVRALSGAELLGSILP
jgi:hypothetical protein